MQNIVCNPDGRRSRVPLFPLPRHSSLLDLLGRTMPFQTLLLATVIGSALFALYRFRRLTGPNPLVERPNLKTSLWMGSLFLLMGVEILTIVLAWDLHEPVLSSTTTLVLIWSGVLLAHGGFEAQRGWSQFLENDFEPECGSLTRGLVLAVDGVRTADGDQVERVRYHRHLLLMSTLLLFGAMVMVTIIGGMIRTRAFPEFMSSSASTTQVAGARPTSAAPGAGGAAQDTSERPSEDSSALPSEPEPGAGATAEEVQPATLVASAEALGAERDRQSRTLALLLVIGVSNAVLGAIFYVAQSYRRKRDVIIGNFDPDLFWASLWYRVGEAALITVVVFFFLLYFVDVSSSPNGKLPWNVATLPLLGLLIGIRVKQAEGVVRLFSERTIGVFHMMLTGEAPASSVSGVDDDSMSAKKPAARAGSSEAPASSPVQERVASAASSASASPEPSAPLPISDALETEDEPHAVEGSHANPSGRASQGL